MRESSHPQGKAGELAAHVGSLPLLPSVVMRVLALDSDSDRYFDELLAVVAQDPTLAVRLIRLANSAMSAPGKPIVTLLQAAIRVGTRECAGLVTALAVSRVFIPRTQGQRDLWRHALQAAVCARTIVSRISGSRYTPDQAYLAGLLHDIGRFVMFESASADLSLVDETHWQTPQQLLDAEQQLLGYDHVHLGDLVCRRWAIPDAIADIVALHHTYALPDEVRRGGLGELIRVVQMADLVSVLMMSKPDIVEGEPAAVAEEMERSCVRPEWNKPPIAPILLAERIREMYHEAETVTEGLISAHTLPK